MRQNMAIQPSRTPADRVHQRRRQRRVEHWFPALQPGAIQRAESWRTERADPMMEALISAAHTGETRTKVPAEFIQNDGPQR